MRKRRIPPMLADLVQTALSSCDGILFDAGGVCPDCGGGLSGYDVKKKQFALLADGEQKRVIHVLVKRFLCRQCGQVSLAGQPFYPDTRIGSPVIDLCITMSETMPYSRVSSCLGEMGVIVDRWSVRNYVQKNHQVIPSADMFGVRIPISVVTLSSLAMAAPEGSRLDARAMLAACNYPSNKNALL